MKRIIKKIIPEMEPQKKKVVKVVKKMPPTPSSLSSKIEPKRDWLDGALERFRKQKEGAKILVPAHWVEYRPEDVRDQFICYGCANVERLLKGEPLDRNTWVVIARGGRLFKYFKSNKGWK